MRFTIRNLLWQPRKERHIMSRPFIRITAAVTLLIAFAGICFSWVGGSALARGRPMWTYQDLWSKAEMVCIGTVHSTKEVDNNEFHPDHLIELESDIEIVATLKGNAKPDKLLFVHFRYKPEANRLGNGPTFAVLSKPNAKDAAPNTYLFFLKRREDGRFDPVSGQHDAHLSIAQLKGFADIE